MSEQLVIDLDARLIVKPSLVLREESDDCALLFDPDSGCVHLLNPSAVAVWKRLDGCRTLGEIVAGLGEEFAGMGTEAATQVVALAKDLAARGAIGFLRPGS